MKKAYLLIFLMMPIPGHAQDSSVQFDAVQGHWLASHHTNDDNITTDICVAMEPDAHVAFRVDARDIEMRVSDPSWNLPPNSGGDIIVSAGAYRKSFGSAEDGPNTLVSVLSSEDAKQLMSALETSSSATILFGSKTKRDLPLSGSAKVLGAFQACARRSSLQDVGSPSGASNTPF